MQPTRQIGDSVMQFVYFFAITFFFHTAKAEEVVVDILPASPRVRLAMPAKPPCISPPQSLPHTLPTELKPLKIKCKEPNETASVIEQYSTHNHNLIFEKLKTNIEYEIISENSFRVYFWTGAEECFGSRGITQETDDYIGVAIIEGHPNDAGTCLLYAKQGVFLFHTQHPIGDRPIVQLNAESVDLKR